MLKSSRLNTITYYLSHLLFLLVPMLIIPLIISLLYNEGNQLYRAYYFAILFTLLAAFLLRALAQKNKIEINLTTAMLLCAFSWIVVSLFGSLPFIIGIEKTFIDALFESTAGFTSAGLTVFRGLDLLPKSIIFWLFLIAAGGIITAFFSDLSGWEAYSTMFSAVGNIGLSFISVDKLAALSPIVKIVHIIGMIAGRLEIIPLIILLNPKAWKS